MINCKVELKGKWDKHCVLAGADKDNTDANLDNIIFTCKETKLYVHLVTLSSKDNQEISKFLRKGFERSVYENEYKTKSENENTTKLCRS